MSYSSFLPSSYLLMGAGPSMLHSRVVSSLTRPLISHLDSKFHRLFDEIRELLQYVMQTSSPMTFPIHGSGSLAMEACFANLVEVGDTILVMNNGFYGDRMEQMARRYGGKVVSIKHEWGEILSPPRLEAALKENPKTKIVCFVHGESSTGVMSDVKSLSHIAKQCGALTLCDIAGTLGGVPLYIDEWELDAVYANSQKCLSAPPGLSPISISDRAMRTIRSRKTPVQNWCLDLIAIEKLMKSTPCQRYYPYTSPVHCFYALHEALLMIYEEGLNSLWDRHAFNSKALTSSLRLLGFEMMTQDSTRIPMVNVVSSLKDINSHDFRSYLAQNYNVVISDGMGDWQGKTMRIGAMGYACTLENILICLKALGQTLQHFGKIVNIKEAVNNAENLAFYDNIPPVSNIFMQNNNARVHASYV